jgi:arylsulfatase A-like enzyme
MRRTAIWPGVLLALAACGAEVPQLRPDTPHNVLLISIDTLRADHLGCYGYNRPTSPNLDALAAEGAVFEDASATSPWTVSSHFSILTGLFPRSHGVNGWAKPMPTDIRTLAGHLQELGFATGAFVNHLILNAERGFGTGFETFLVEDEKLNPRGKSQTILDNAGRWLEQQGQARFFLFVHLYDVHSSYISMPRFKRRFIGEYEGDVNGYAQQLKDFRLGTLDWSDDDVGHLVDLYDAGIAQLDDTLGGFFDGLKARGQWDNTLIIVTSDHGEEFLEHGDVLHGGTLYQELLHVPLILRGPGIPTGRRLGHEVTLVDLLPTVLSFVGLPPPGDVEGVDLRPTLLDPALQPPERWIFAEADKWFNKERGNYRRSIRRGRYKLHYDHLSDGRTLFDLEADPGEEHDISAEHPELTETLWAKLQEYMAGSREVDATIEVSPEEIKALEALGYM